MRERLKALGVWLAVATLFGALLYGCTRDPGADSGPSTCENYDLTLDACLDPEIDPYDGPFGP
ncbi:MAG TPA: hypothetical protein VHK22_06620 [Gaiellaceae bacterium]|jgi:hypothetical protein|nr:hypothetical protein [Gaiellaceae bacterium]HEX2505863.1 hypothetical protein [Gaiellaceae bacterium]